MGYWRFVSRVVAVSLAASACARSFESRLARMSAEEVTKDYPVVGAVSPRFAAILAASGELPFEARGPSTPLAIRWVTMSANPRYMVFRIEADDDSAKATWHWEGGRKQSWPVSRVAWLSLQSTLIEVDAWTAQWRSPLILDGISYGLEMREGSRHRVAWIHNPERRESNEGLLRMRDAIIKAMGLKIVES